MDHAFFPVGEEKSFRLAFAQAPVGDIERGVESTESFHGEDWALDRASFLSPRVSLSLGEKVAKRGADKRPETSLADVDRVEEVFFEELEEIGLAEVFRVFGVRVPVATDVEVDRWPVSVTQIFQTTTELGTLRILAREDDAPAGGGKRAAGVRVGRCGRTVRV